MKQATNIQTPPLGELYMILQYPQKLAKLMVIQDVSHRKLAVAAGWKSHSYVSRLLRGEARTLDVEPALRIAAFLGVGVDDLFLTKVTSNPGLESPSNGKSQAA